MTRFQEASWYIKLYRYRYYLTIPYNTVRTWIKQRTGSPNAHKENIFTIWGIYKGLAQMDMNWWLTSEELEEQYMREK